MIDVRRSRPFQLTFVGGEKTTEIFLQSLELGHSAATRAIKASGGHWGNPCRDGQGEVGSCEGRAGEGRKGGRRSREHKENPGPRESGPGRV